MEKSEILELKEIVTDSLSKIMHFIGCSQIEIDEAKEMIDGYQKETDEDVLRDRRRILNKFFFEVYSECVFRAFEEDSDPVPIQVQMLLLYGYMDENLAGLHNAIAIAKLTQTYRQRTKTYAVSLFEWLALIYLGHRNTSMNDMSVDYEQDLREQLKNKEITENVFNELIRDKNKRVLFELTNAFSIMKRVSGAPTRFLAIFNEKSLEKPLLKTFVVNKDVEDLVDGIANIDVNLFWHEYTYANPDVGIENVRISKEIKPDIILLPMIGARPMMWQEIEGRNRQTPARFFFPSFLNSELKDQLIKCCGAYRWEYCRREQGARWQDMSDPSLCSYYYNYIQTYKKNHHLSQEQKEKVHAQYTKYRHNIKDIFVEDYVKYIANEAVGNIRLNKESRRILMRFCILNKYIREELIKNNLYTEYINAINNKISHDKKYVSTIKKRVEEYGKKIPREVLEYESLINR